MDKTPMRSNPLQDPVRAKSMYRLIRGIFDFWKVAENHRSLLLGINHATWASTQAEEMLPPLSDLASRVSALIRIYHMSGDLYPRDPNLAAQWIHRPIFVEPFWGVSPRQFMLLDVTRDGTDKLRLTSEYLHRCFMRWNGLRDHQGRLMRCDDERRMSEEPIDTLAQMMLRIQGSWKFPDVIFERIIGVKNMTEISDVAIGKHVPSQRAITQMRCIACIDIALWRNVQDDEKISLWMLSLSSHALFGGAPPYHLLLSQNPSVARVVYSYIRNTSP